MVCEVMGSASWKSMRMPICSLGSGVGGRRILGERGLARSAVSSSAVEVRRDFDIVAGHRACQ